MHTVNLRLTEAREGVKASQLLSTGRFKSHLNYSLFLLFTLWVAEEPETGATLRFERTKSTRFFPPAFQVGLMTEAPSLSRFPESVSEELDIKLGLPRPGAAGGLSSVKSMVVMVFLALWVLQ